MTFTFMRCGSKSGSGSRNGSSHFGSSRFNQSHFDDSRFNRTHFGSSSPKRTSSTSPKRKRTPSVSTNDTLPQQQIPKQVQIIVPVSNVPASKLPSTQKNDTCLMICSLIFVLVISFILLDFWINI